MMMYSKSFAGLQRIWQGRHKVFLGGRRIQGYYQDDHGWRQTGPGRCRLSAIHDCHWDQYCGNVLRGEKLNGFYQKPDPIKIILAAELITEKTAADYYVRICVLKPILVQAAGCRRPVSFHHWSIYGWHFLCLVHSHRDKDRCGLLPAT